MAETTSSGTATVTLPTDEQILITREFDAPKHLVYEAWTTPELVKRWWNAKRGEVTIAYEDMRFVNRASEEGQLETTFTFYVNGGDVRHEQGFAVELFEEGSCNAAGMLGAARFPAEGSSPLRAPVCVSRTVGKAMLTLTRPPVALIRCGSTRLPTLIAIQVPTRCLATQKNALRNHPFRASGSNAGTRPMRVSLRDRPTIVPRSPLATPPRRGGRAAEGTRLLSE